MHCNCGGFHDFGNIILARGRHETIATGCISFSLRENDLITPPLTPPTKSTEVANHVASGARWSLCLLLTINLFNYIDRYILAAVVPEVQRDFNASDKVMGLMATAFLLSYMCFAPLFGWLADRYRRWMLIGGAVLVWSLASGATGLAATLTMMFLLRIFVGVGEAAYGPVAPTIIADMYPVARRGQVLAWFYVAIPVGTALGFLLGGRVLAMGFVGIGRFSSSCLRVCCWAYWRC